MGTNRHLWQGQRWPGATPSREPRPEGSAAAMVGPRRYTGLPDQEGPEPGRQLDQQELCADCVPYQIVDLFMQRSYIVWSQDLFSCSPIVAMLRPYSHNASSGMSTCRMRPLGWMSTCRSGPLPELMNLCGTPAGTTTIWPPVASIVASPTVKVASPSCTTKISS